MTLIRAERLTKTYRAGEVDVLAVKSVDFTIDAKLFVAFVGLSGSGKTSLLNMIGCLAFLDFIRFPLMNRCILYDPNHTRCSELAVTLNKAFCKE